MEKTEAIDPKLSDNALAILRKRYFRKDPDGNIVEDWHGLCTRVANFIASAENEGDRSSWAAEFYYMMYQLKFLPNSPTLFNADMPLGNLSACFVLPVEDSLEGIFDTLKNAAIIFASGGGCGYDFSDLRKRGSRVSRTSGVSSGPVSFIHVFNSATEIIKQGGKRRGANMGVLRVDHPDIVEFIDAKTEEGTLANFNLSVAITDEFMYAIEDQRKFVLYDYYLGKPDKEIWARSLFDKIVERTWTNGEPGVIFIDRINEKNPLPDLGDIAGVNPCSEEPLLPDESCNLGSINLAHFYKEKKDEHKFESVNWGALASTVHKAVRFLDDVISVNRYPVKAIETASLRTRKIGLGVMGWADLLLMLKIKYDSDEAVELAALVMEWIQYNALEASMELAKKRGRFPAFDCYTLPDRSASKWHKDKVNWEELDKGIQEHGLRNACVSTVAPTGSLSLIAGVSSGIEPNFQWMYEYYRVEQKFSEKHWIASLFLDKGAPLPEYFVTALDIAPIWHIKMQAAWQKWVDAGISKTINLPFEATKEDVREAILEAWRMKCKGITLYRSGSREKEVLVAKGKEQLEVPETTGVSPRERPMFTYGSTVKIPVGADCGTMFVTVNSDEFGPCESFVMLGRGGGCISSYAEALGRMISLALRSGVDVKEVVDQLSGIRCSKIRWMKERTVHSCPDAVAYALERVLLSEDPDVLTKEDLEKAFDNLARHKVPPTLEDFEEADKQARRDYVRFRSIIESGENPECPECHAMLSIEGRCVLCRACGYTRCS